MNVGLLLLISFALFAIFPVFRLVPAGAVNRARPKSRRPGQDD